MRLLPEFHVVGRRSASWLHLEEALARAFLKFSLDLSVVTAQ
jgi:hypothetical protein